MRHNPSSPLLIARGALVALASPREETQKKPVSEVTFDIQKWTYDFKETGKDMEYALFVPSSYDKARKWPLRGRITLLEQARIPLPISLAPARKCGILCRAFGSSAMWNKQNSAVFRAAVYLPLMGCREKPVDHSSEGIACTKAGQHELAVSKFTKAIQNRGRPKEDLLPNR